MKQMIFGFVSAVILVLFTAVVVTVHGRALRQSEISQSLGEAMQMTMQKLTEEKRYEFESRDEFVADFLEAFLMQVNSESDFEINILKADEKKGLLSVEVVETFRHANGELGSVSARRDIILDRSVSNERRAK